MKLRTKMSSLLGGTALLVSVVALAPAAHAASLPDASAPSTRITVLPPSAPDGQISYIVLGANGDIEEDTIGHPGPLASALAARDHAQQLAAAPAGGVVANISQPSSCDGTGDDLDLQRTGAHPFCFNGQGSASVTVTNVEEILVGPNHVADIHYHTPGNAVASEVVIANPNQHLYTDTVHWTADEEAIV